MAAHTQDLVLQTYFIELTRARTLTPDQLVDELGTRTTMWAAVTLCSSAT